MASKPDSIERGRLLADIFWSLILRSTSALVQLLPEVFVPRMALVCGTLWFRLFRWRRSVILRNLTQAFPEMASHDRLTLGQASCIHMVQTGIESFRIPRYVRGRLDDLVRFDGIQHYEAARKQSKGVLLVTGHLGSFELALAAGARRYPPVSIVARTFTRRVDQFVNANRMCAGARIIPSKGATKAILRALKNNELVIVLIDRNSSPSKGVFVDFFGQPACTVMGLAVIACRTGAPVIGGASWRESDGRHVIRFYPEFPLERLESVAETVRHMTQVYTRFIEQRLRAHPHQWIWPHQRWRTRPCTTSPAE